MPTISEITNNHKLYVTRTWGFDPHKWGVVSFPQEGSVDNWINKMEGNIYVLCFASHKTNKHIPEKNQGRVFGIYEAEPKKMHYKDEDAIEDSYLNKTSSRSFKENGEFRWPWGLKATRAWKFINQNIFTRETLPVSRALGFEIASNISPINHKDYNLLNQPVYQLEEVQVYKRPPPKILTYPNARPDCNYLFLCENQKILEKIPNWKKGEILVKPGISSNVSDRLDTINNHPISKIFQIQFHERWSKKASSETQARETEQIMIKEAQRVGRLAAEGQEEYFFVPAGKWTSLINIAKGITKVS